MDARPDASEIELLRLFFGAEPEIAAGSDWRCSRAAAKVIRAWREHVKAQHRCKAPTAEEETLAD